MSIEGVIARAQEYLIDHGMVGWLVYDYRGMNPILQDTLGPIAHVTRPCWLWVPARGDPRLLVSYVDQGRFSQLGLPTTLFVSRKDMTERLAALLADSGRIAMEYFPSGALPRASKVDAGTLEMGARAGGGRGAVGGPFAVRDSALERPAAKVPPDGRRKAGPYRAGRLRLHRGDPLIRTDGARRRGVHSTPLRRGGPRGNRRAGGRRQRARLGPTLRAGPLKRAPPSSRATGS